MNQAANTIELYVAQANPKETARALEKLGAPKVTSNKDLLSKLEFATRKFGTKVYEKLAEVETPYRSLILTEYEKHKEKKSGCDGCGGTCGQGKSNACGCSHGFNGDNWNGGNSDNNSDDDANAQQIEILKKSESHRTMMFVAIGASVITAIVVAMAVKK